MNLKEQAQAFYLKDAHTNYLEGNYAASIALCKIVLILDSKMLLLLNSYKTPNQPLIKCEV